MTCKKTDLVFPYDLFLYPSLSFSKPPSWTSIAKKFKAEEVQIHILDELISQFPERADYYYYRAKIYLRNPFYDKEDFEKCNQIIEKGISCPSYKGYQNKLEKCAIELQKEEKRFHELSLELGIPEEGERGPLPPYRKENFDKIEAIILELLAKGDFENCDWLIQVHFDRQEPDKALELYCKYCDYCRRLGNHVIPGSPLAQEKIIGYLAQTNPEKALATINEWLQAKVCIVSDVIRKNERFHHLFPMDIVEKALVVETTKAHTSKKIDWISENQIATDTLLLAWQERENKNVYMWLVFSAIFNTGVVATCDYQIRPDKITKDKVLRFPNRNSLFDRRPNPYSPFTEYEGASYGHNFSDRKRWLLTTSSEQKEFCEWAIESLRSAVAANPKAKRVGQGSQIE